ncbi:flagellar basal body P-ring formation chaperone FlgA [Vibrio alfacsensis]|uniref:flagellar basal body P-ring formation chaperone FlgA n=1 Tax=Vibrio alfacsensis TaxID=1074311 RepID=UPI0040693F01
MTYNKGRKPRFRVTEPIQSKWKGPFSSMLMVSALALNTFTQAAVPTNKTLTVDELNSVIREQFSQEVERAAQAGSWGHYQLDYDIWIPSSANHLPACDSPLVITGRDNQPLPVGNLKRSVSCEDLRSPWRLNVSIKSTLTLPVVVATTTVGRNETITPSHVKLETRTISRQNDFYTHPKQAINLETTRRLRAGQIVNPNSVSSPPLIEKGNEVLLIAGKDGFSASTKGVALENGKRGQQIEVKNASSGKVVRAIVTGLNQVHTQF